MARGGGRDGGGDRRRSPKDAGRRPAKKKVCVFCSGHVKWVDYKDVNVLRRFMSDRGKIRARRVSGNCAQHQRDVAVAIKTARELALLPYTQRTVAERGPGRGRPPRDDARAEVAVVAEAEEEVLIGDEEGLEETALDVEDVVPVGGEAETP